MKLPEFENILDLLKKSGLDIHESNYTINWEKVIKDPKLLELRSTGYFKIEDQSDIGVSKDKTLEYLGDKVVVYIYDYVTNHNKYGGGLPSLHFYECNTIKEMKSKNKFENKYVNSNNNFNGEYKLLLKNYNNESREKLPVCSNCIKEAKNDGLIDKELLLDENGNFSNKNTFSLNKYFDFYGYYQYIKGNNKYNFITIPKNQYPENWEEISKHERQKVGYICQDCGKDCKNNKYDLHVHHKDHNKGNNFSDNFEVLCYNCHAKHHEHM